jgi:hypothetical protein
VCVSLMDFEIWNPPLSHAEVLISEHLCLCVPRTLPTVNSEWGSQHTMWDCTSGVH